MKGLMLKDGYVILRQYRTTLLIALLFLAIGAVRVQSMFFLLYPILVIGVLPVSLLALDEKTGWSEYAASLPVSWGEIVSAKYLESLLGMLAGGLLGGATLLLRGEANGVEPLGFILTVAATGLLAPAVMLPIAFRFGSEKSRVGTMILGGAVAGIATLGLVDIPENGLRLNPYLLIAVALALFAASWCAAIPLAKRGGED